MITQFARIVPAKNFIRKSLDPFRVTVANKLLFSYLSKSKNISVGHTIEHGHHYDVFIDVRQAIQTNDKLAQDFRFLLQGRLSVKKNVVIYSEDSELSPIIGLLKWTSGMAPINWLPARHAFDDTFVWGEPKKSLKIKDSEVIIIDEGAYSCSSLLGMLKLVLEEKPSSIDVIVPEKRFTYNSLAPALKKIDLCG